MKINKLIGGGILAFIAFYWATSKKTAQSNCLVKDFNQGIGCNPQNEFDNSVPDKLELTQIPKFFNLSYVAADEKYAVKKFYNNVYAMYIVKNNIVQDAIYITSTLSNIVHLTLNTDGSYTSTGPQAPLLATYPAYTGLLYANPTLDDLIAQGIDAKIPLPSGATKGRTPNTFQLHGYWYKFDPTGVMPERFNGGVDVDGLFHDVWEKSVSYPVIWFKGVNSTDPAARGADGLFDMTNLSNQVGSFLDHHYMFKGEPLQYYTLIENDHVTAGQILNKLVWTPTPHFTQTKQTANPGALISQGWSQSGFMKPVV